MQMNKTDAAVIRASRKDPAAFGAIFDRHWPKIYRYCVERAGPAVGEDVAAETFRVAFTDRKRYDGRDEAAPWLYGIATNLLRRWFRSAARGSRAASRVGAEVSGDELEAIVDRLDLDHLAWKHRVVSGVTSGREV
jgi:DNA-directed RNA polymerase specialized sigma24 family protein